MVRRVLGDFFPARQVHGILAPEHAAAVARLFATDPRHVSLLGCTSFLIIRQRGCAKTIAFGPVLAAQGVPVIPH